MTAVLLASLLLALFLGSVRMSPADVLRALFGIGEEKYSIIVRALRLPRILAAILAGVGLSVSGLLLQSVTGNRLASPNIIGVNAGAGFAAILTLSMFPRAVHALPFAAFLGAFAATLLIVRLAASIRASHISVILAGMALTAILNAGISFISLLEPEVITAYNDFSIGGLSGVTAERLLVPAILIVLSLALTAVLAPQISMLCLGDRLAASLGVRVSVIRTVCLLCASASAAAVVSFAGLLGFVGLIVPHIAKRLVGIEIRHALPAAALCGAALVLLGDTLGRTLFSPTELPVGIVMALIGAPFFLILLLGGRRHA